MLHVVESNKWNSWEDIETEQPNEARKTRRQAKRKKVNTPCRRDFHPGNYIHSQHLTLCSNQPTRNKFAFFKLYDSLRRLLFSFLWIYFGLCVPTTFQPFWHGMTIYVHMYVLYWKFFRLLVCSHPSMRIDHHNHVSFNFDYSQIARVPRGQKHEKSANLIILLSHFLTVITYVLIFILVRSRTVKCANFIDLVALLLLHFFVISEPVSKPFNTSQWTAKIAKTD